MILDAEKSNRCSGAFLSCENDRPRNIRINILDEKERRSQGFMRRNSQRFTANDASLGPVAQSAPQQKMVDQRQVERVLIPVPRWAQGHLWVRTNQLCIVPFTWPEPVSSFRLIQVVFLPSRSQPREKGKEKEWPQWLTDMTALFFP